MKITMISALLLAISGSAFANTNAVTNAHEMAAISHQSMNNSDSAVHQDMANQHLKQAEKTSSKINTANQQVSNMNEHQRAIMSHQRMNNSEAPAHQDAIERHRKLDTAN